MPLFLVMLYFPFPMSTRAHSDSTGVPLMPVSVSWQHTAIHPGTGEHLVRSYTHIWQQAVPMSPSKQATKAGRSKQRTAFPWKQRQAEAPSPAVLGCHLALAAFPSDSFLPSLWQGQVACGHLPAIGHPARGHSFLFPCRLGWLLEALWALPILSAFWAHQLCAVHDFVCDCRSDPASSRTVAPSPPVKPQFLYRAPAQPRH